MENHNSRKESDGKWKNKAQLAYYPSLGNVMIKEIVIGYLETFRQSNMFQQVLLNENHALSHFVDFFTDETKWINKNE